MAYRGVNFTFHIDKFIQSTLFSSYLVNIRKRCFLSAFYIRRSVHRNSRLKKSNEMQQYAYIYSLLNYSICFGRPSRPSSGEHKTVVAASGIDNTVKYKSLTRSVILSNRL